MIFYVRWTPFDGKNMEVITRFVNVDVEATTGIMEEMGIKIICHIELTEGGGFMLAEAESPAVITLFTAPWSDIMKIEICTVIDRDEALANYKKIVEMVAQMESSSNDYVYGVTYRPDKGR